MTEHILSLSDGDLRSLAAALRSGRITVPCTAVSLRRIVSAQIADRIAVELQSLAGQGFGPAQLAALFDLLVQDRSRRLSPDEVIDLVTTGPEAGATANRDTSVVVRQLFAEAEQSVLVAGYAVYQGQRVFQALADRMQEKPHLAVRMFLDVRRGPGDTSMPAEIVRRFGERFVRHDWPAERPLPEVYYFPLSLEEIPNKRAALHAKCVVVDHRLVFVSSANFTEAAHNRNIEVGLLIRSETLARQLAGHFNSMTDDGLLKPVFES